MTPARRSAGVASLAGGGLTVSATLYASYLVQIAGALLGALVLGSFFRAYRKSFLSYWASSWICLSVMLVGAVLGADLATRPGVPPMVSLSVAVVGGVASYLQVAWLLCGAFELVSQGSVTPGHRRAAIAAAIAAGLVGSLLFAWDPAAAEGRFFVRVSLRGLVAALAFFVAAFCVWHGRMGPRQLGRRIVTIALVVFGLHQLVLLWVGLAHLISQARLGSILYVGVADLVASVALALGVAIWLLEGERQAAREFAAQVEKLAYHDPLTGLPNRQLFLDHLQLAIAASRRERHRLAVLFIDLDRFKVINDSLGHAVGDRLLQIVAQRLKDALRSNDIVARMGGDEFTVLAPVVQAVDDPVHVARRIQDAVRQPMWLDDRELFVTASIGISFFPDDGETGDVLLKHADTAMYRAKAQGPDLFQLFTSEMNAHVLEQLALEHAMRRAVTHGEFELHYQPIVDMRDGRVAAVEAMLRWRHPEFGVLRPGQFLGLAEATGLIVQVGDWALREGCRHLRAWRELHPDLRLAINVSRRQLRQPEFVPSVFGVLTAEQIPASALELDLGESSTGPTDEQAVVRLRELRAAGVRVAIDDFGTGYSSVGRLRSFPVDALKIDTSFVRDLVTDPKNAEIAAAVIALARALKLSVTAEGVENPDQLEFLRLQGCEMWQGYLCCPPLPADEITAFLARRTGRTGRPGVLPDEGQPLGPALVR